ncbi:MAG: HsmA family protein [Candidatus Bathyarchaeia archaeon]|jgi:uncharacterized repeat protein (TIGR03987 family)
MDVTILLFSTIAITLALIFYSIGVWSERFARILKPKHLAFFWAGFVFDSTGTTLMAILASTVSNGTFLNVHAVTGVLAIVLMLFHAIWATITLVSGNERRLRSFHKFSLVVWVIWLIPYCIGFVANIPGI